MIKIAINAGALRYDNVYFSVKPNWTKLAGLTCFSRCNGNKELPLLIRESANTKIIDLKVATDDIWSHFQKDTQYEIRRSDRDGLVFGLEEGFSRFYEYYLGFTKLKAMPVMPKYYLEAHYPHLVVTTSSLNGEVVCMHSYLVDRDIGRAMLFTSASMYRAEDNSANRSLIGRSNRWLHYKDMLYFKEAGFATYDLGGYAAHTMDPALKKINDFKDSFGGVLLEESTYITLPLWLARFANKHIKRRRLN